ncbi:MAG TPA: tetratricopeptide repeat protein [Aggregatilineales bacterium]|nr:tetratricopeptide repeat protein [Aggregatilineales bacterium]
MSSSIPAVFISYRRSVSWAFARLVFNDLRMHGFDVFMDVESINAGEFETVILNQIAARAHFVVVLAPGSAERLTNPGDWLRREIEFGMDLGRNIIPLLVNGFRFEDFGEYFTGKLERLPDYNAVTLHHEYFDAGMQRLRERFIGSKAAGIVQPAPEEDQPIIDSKLEVLAGEPAPSPAELRAEAHFQLGMQKLQARDYAGAIHDFTEAIRLQPDYSEAHNNRGVAQFHCGNYEIAIEDYDKAIRLSESPVSAYTNRGNARAHRGDFSGAVQDYDTALRLNPLYFEAYYNRGIIRVEQKRYEDAIIDYTKAIQLQMNDASVHASRAYAYVLTGDYGQAAAGYRRALELQPDYAVALSGLAICEHALGNIEAARRLWQKLIRRDARYRDPMWFRDTLLWHDAAVAEARKLLRHLEDQ